MDKLYSLIGFGFVWGGAAFLLALAGYLLWRRRPRTKAERYIGNAFVWVWVFLLGKRWHMPKEGAWLLLSAYRGKERLTSWERDIIALNFRHNRRIGWRRPH